MEDETRKFLLLIVNTIALVLLWMILQMMLGIYFNLAFFEDTPGWKNFVYYLFFIVTLIALLRYLKRKWL